MVIKLKKRVIFFSLIILGLFLVGACSASVDTKGNTVTVGGLNFNIPDGFEVNQSSIQENSPVSRQIGEGAQVVPAKQDHVSMIGKGSMNPGDGVININVFTFDNEQDAQNHLRYYNDKMIVHEPKESKVNGIDGYDGGGLGMSSFYYLKGNQIIFVQVNDDHLIPKVIPN